jgi:hypothetical protein
MATTAKIAEVMFDDALDVYETQEMLLPLVKFEQPKGDTMQNTGNFIWRPIQQSAPIISGWDLTGLETTIIQEEYPAILGTPSNDFVQQRVDELRDISYWEERGRESGRRQASELNLAIANAIAVQGTLFLRTNTSSGYTALGTAQAIMNERQRKNTNRAFILNDRDNLLYAQDLAGRQTLQGRPDKVWANGQIGNNIAEFDVYTGSFLPNLVGGADPATTVIGNQSFIPQAGSVNATTGVVTNYDYRSATIVVAASAGYNIGDKVTIANAGVTVKALGLADKSNTGQAMTFTVLAKPDGTHMTISPKPIALDDAALTTTEVAYANIDTQILNAATVNRLNIEATNKTNLFFDKTAVEVLGGAIPAELFQKFDGMKVLSQKMKNGLTMYMVYDGNIATMNFRFRLFTWYGITVCSPADCGVMVTY